LISCEGNERAGQMDDGRFAAVEEAAVREVEEALEFAMGSPEPPLEEIELDIYDGRFIE